MKINQTMSANIESPTHQQNRGRCPKLSAYRINWMEYKNSTCRTKCNTADEKDNDKYFSSQPIRVAHQEIGAAFEKPVILLRKWLNNSAGFKEMRFYK